MIVCVNSLSFYAKVVQFLSFSDIFFSEHTHLLQKCEQDGTLLPHISLLQSLPEVLQGDAGTVGPQVGVKTPLGYRHMLIYQAEQFVTLWEIGS